MPSSHMERKPPALGKKTVAAILVTGLFGQVAWTVENMYFSVFLYNTILPDTGMIALMVAASALCPLSEEEPGSLRLLARLLNPRPWSPEDPYLYTYALRLGADRVEGHFAMRSFGVGKDHEGTPRLTLPRRAFWTRGTGRAAPIPRPAMK